VGRPSIVDPILDLLLRRLAGGSWAPGTTVPATRQLAAEFDVSRKPLQAALKRAARHKLLEVRERRPVVVLPGAQERAKRLLVRQLKRLAVRRVAVLIPDDFLPLAERSAIWAAMVGTLAREAPGKQMQTRVVAWPAREQVAIARSLAPKGYAAAIFLGFKPEYLVSLSLLREQGFPVVIFNRRVPGLDVPTVVMDDYAASQNLADRLVKLGHRNLCMVSNRGSPEDDIPYERVGGWLDYVKDNGLLDTCSMPVYVPVWPLHLGVWNRMFTGVFHSRNRPTALVFSHSPWAKSFLADPQFADLEVPRDISLVTFEPTRSIPTAPWCPPLTTVQIDHQRTAQCMIEMIDKMLGGEPHPPTIRVPLTVTLTGSIGEAPADRAP